MDKFLETIKNFLSSLPGLITVGVLVLLVVLLVVLLIVVLVKKHKYKKDYLLLDVAYEAAKKENEHDKTAMTDLNARINTLTNESAKMKKDYSALGKDYETLSTELAEAKAAYTAKEAEKAALEAELAEAKKRKVTKKKAAEKKPSVKKYTKEELEAMTKHELMTLAKTAGYDGFYHKSKDELIAHILEAQTAKKKAK